MQRNKSFTLIELLVVISIISLLASVVLASLNGVRDKGRLAAAQLQDSALYHAFGANAVVNLEMNEGSGTVLSDSSGNGNNGGFTPASGFPQWSTNTFNGKGSSLLFNSIGALLGTGVPVGLSSQVVTVAAWVYVSGACGSYCRVVNNNWVGNGWLLFISPLYYPIFGVAQGGTQYNAQFNSPLSLNTWHLLVGSYDGSKVQLYVDGAQVASSPLSSANMTVTGGLDAGGGMNGYISKIRVYSQAITLGQVQRMYAEGKERFLGLSSGASSSLNI